MINTLDPLYAFIYELTGLTFPANNRSTLDTKVSRFFEKKSILEENSVTSVQSDSQLLQELLDFLTVNESYFFREMAVIDEMIKRINQRPGKVRILCAPSSSGEESYTIVMALLKAGKPASEIEIVGIDINSSVIDMAQEALYTKRRVHRVEESDLERYFTLEDDKYRLKDEVRQCVSFSKLNIFDTAISGLGRFDIVFSRNMLIYFDKESSKRAEKVFYDVLKPDGYLLVGHADFISNSMGFDVEMHNGHYFYKK